MSQPVVRGLIPDGVQQTLIGLQPTIAGVSRKVKIVWQPAADLLGWKDPGKSRRVAVVALLVSPVFIYIQRPCFVLVTLYVFTTSITIFRNCLKLRKARQQVRNYAAKAFKSWPFFSEKSSDAVESNEDGSLLDAIRTYAACATRNSAFATYD